MSSAIETTHPISTFPQFPDLAIELRIQIWKHAINSARPSRVIPVTINHHPAVTIHSCLALHGKFCGEHSLCPSYNAESGQPSSSVVCMFNGYFTLEPNTPDIYDSAIHDISLVCTESHSVVLSLYPETMTVYKNTWNLPGASQERRLVRCNPATDILLINSIPSYYSEQQHPDPSRNNPEDMYHQDIVKWFPQDPAIFASFRRIITRFRHVGIRLLNAHSGEIPPPSETFKDQLFKQFLIAFESLERLDVCYNLEGLTLIQEVWDRVDDIKALRDGSTNDLDLQDAVGTSSGVLNCDDSYIDYVRAHSSISTGGECCWVPMPRGFGGSWVFHRRQLIDQTLRTAYLFFM